MIDPRGAARIMAEQCLCFRARRVSRALTRLYDEVLRPLGIQATQLTVLNAIAARRPRGGEDGGTMGELARILAMDPTTFSRTVRPLAKDGLVTIRRSASDRRVRRVRLTEAGERKIEEALPHWRRAHGRVVEALGEDLAAELCAGFDATVAAARAGSGSDEINGNGAE